jgi:hypothetical protein
VVVVVLVVVVVVVVAAAVAVVAAAAVVVVAAAAVVVVVAGRWRRHFKPKLSNGHRKVHVVHDKQKAFRRPLRSPSHALHCAASRRRVRTPSVARSLNQVTPTFCRYNSALDVATSTASLYLTSAVAKSRRCTALVASCSWQNG